MSVIAVLRALAGRVVEATEGRARTAGGKGDGQDKRPCHECRKSLTGLANSRAGRSVGGRKAGILSYYQCAALHSGAKQPLKAAP
ncbi:MAG: hypothetical protein HLUCCA08_18110 [Rhodobacteraceae bacterium HLUCCA08]|nr:MAG: hypothetical protein HLUCCA08_18110 [Rhodobacteraceae bacterium HLUCCA08]